MSKIIYSASLVLGVMLSLAGYSQGSPADLPSSSIQMSRLYLQLQLKIISALLHIGRLLYHTRQL